MRSMSFTEIKDKIVKSLSTNVKRFKCPDGGVAATNKSNKCYGLRMRNAPPLSHHPILPLDNSVVTEKFVKEYLRVRLQILPKRYVFFLFFFVIFVWKLMRKCPCAA